MISDYIIKLVIHYSHFNAITAVKMFLLFSLNIIITSIKIKADGNCIAKARYFQMRRAQVSVLTDFQIPSTQISPYRPLITVSAP
jgi:hypothetical protein